MAFIYTEERRFLLKSVFSKKKKLSSPIDILIPVIKENRIVDFIVIVICAGP